MEEHDNAKAILLEMGEFFQIQVQGASQSPRTCKAVVVVLMFLSLYRTITWTALVTRH